jgi:hypothetical protein
VRTLNAIKSYRREGDEASCNPGLDPFSGRFKPMKEAPYPFYRRLIGFQSRFVCDGKEKNPCPCKEWNPQSICPLSVTLTAELSHLILTSIFISNIFHPASTMFTVTTDYSTTFLCLYFSCLYVRDYSRANVQGNLRPVCLTLVLIGCNSHSFK